MEIGILKQQGHSIREISRLTGHSRNTVRRYLRDNAMPVYQRPGRPSKLDPYKPYLAERLAAAHSKRLPATVLYREILERGFTGKERIVRDYVSSFYPQPKPNPVVRFEISPGQQMQVDWCVLQRGKRPLSAFVATLGYSRVSYVEFTTDETFETLKRFHSHAFTYFQGVIQDVLYENMKTVVTERNAYGHGRHRFHAGLWDLASHYGFTPRLCKPYRAQTKGKVERFNRYLRESFYNPLITQLTQAGLILDSETANAEVLKWLRDVANCRVRRTLNERPVDRLLKEQPYLQPLPPAIALHPPARRPATPAWPVESLQRPASTYDQLMGVEL